MQKIDPRAKLIWTVTGILLVFLSANLIQQLLISGMILGWSLFLKSFRRMLHSIRYLLFLLPITFIIHSLFSANLVGIVKIEGLTGLAFADFWVPILFTLRLGNLMLFMAIELLWFKPLEFIDSCYYLLRPFKRLRLPVDDIFQMIFIAVRFFPILRSEYGYLDQSRRNFFSRGKETLSQRIIGARDVLVPLMVFSFQRAEILAESMVVRGYGKQKNRSYFAKLHFAIGDVVFIFSGLGLLVMILYGLK
jgi:energy-coupling factor transport system permease protein